MHLENLVSSLLFQGKLNAADLKQRCSIFYKTLTPKDYKLLVGDSGESLIP